MNEELLIRIDRIEAKIDALIILGTQPPHGQAIIDYIQDNRKGKA